MITKGWRTGLIWLGLIIFWVMRAGISNGTMFVSYGEPYEVVRGNMIYTYQDPIVNYGAYYFVWTIAVLMTLAGCYIWAKLKNRHWAFLFWGILSPIGLLGISLLHDKSAKSEGQNDEVQEIPS